MLIRALFFYFFYTSCFAAEVKRYHYVLRNESDDGGVSAVARHTFFYRHYFYEPNSEIGFISVYYYPESGLSLEADYPRITTESSRSLIAKFPAPNQALVEGPRRSVDVYLDERKTASWASPIGVVAVSIDLPVASRRIRVVHDTLFDTRLIAVDIEESVPMDTKKDWRRSRLAWRPHPLMSRNADDSYPDQAYLHATETVASRAHAGINCACLASDAIGKIAEMEVQMISPTAGQRFGPLFSLAVLKVHEPVYHQGMHVDIRVNKHMVRQEGTGEHTFRVICTTTKGVRLEKETKFPLKSVYLGKVD